MLLKPLPFPDSDRVVLLYNSYPNAGAPRVGAAVPDYFDRQTAVTALDMQAVFRREGMTLGDESGAERLSTHSRHAVVLPRRARRSDAWAACSPTTKARSGRIRRSLLSYAFWKRKFGGAPVDRSA